MPFVPIGETNCQIGVRTLEMKSAISLTVQETGAGAKRCIMCCPSADWIFNINARSREDCICQLASCNIFRLVRKHELCPCRIGIRHDIPVNIKTRDLFECWLIGLRISTVGT